MYSRCFLTASDPSKATDKGGNYYSSKDKGKWKKITIDMLVPDHVLSVAVKDKHSK